MRQLSHKCVLYSEMFVAETLYYSRYTQDIIEYILYHIFTLALMKANIKLLANLEGLIQKCLHMQLKYCRIVDTMKLI